MHAAQTPVPTRDRVWIMDALRGFAILGILIANLNTFTFYMFGPVPDGRFLSMYDGTVQFWHHVLIEGKFYSIFSFLFGWGIALQLSRNAGGEKPAVNLVRRRLGIMFLLGMAHLIFLWIGDIVALYALVGFLLLPMRHWKTKTLFITAIALILSPILLYFLKMQWPFLAAPTGILMQTAGGIWDYFFPGASDDAGLNAAVHNATYIDIIKLDIGGLFMRYGDLFFQSRISKVLGMFIFGYLMGREGFYKKALDDKGLLVKVAIAGLLIGLPAKYALANYMEGDGYYNLTLQGWYQTVVYALGVVPLAFAYMAIFFLLAHSRVGRGILQQFRYVGKMAFSNYILHSVIGLFFFTGVGLALDRQVGPLYYTLFGFTVFLVQIVLSRIWLHYFEYGPVEWIWRSATYRKWQPMKKKIGLTQVIS
ncbi:MAG TPA: DUF418 domain-containing protein [Flavisolibacter sp.]|nr:DUF418 domain-containing protein [Flavisolibacter sp.]